MSGFHKEKDVTPTKIKEINYSREDFFGIVRERTLVPASKEVISKVLEKLSPRWIIHAAILKPKNDFARKVMTVEKPDTVSINYIILM